MIGQSNVTNIVIGKDLDIAANTKTRSDLAVGEIGVFLVGSQTANGAAVLTAGQRFSIVTKNSKGVIVESPVVEYDNISSKKAVDTAASSQRVRSIGFNGTSGAINDANSTNYVAHIFWKDNSKTFGGHGEPVKFAAYYSSTSANQAEIANGLAANFNKNFKRENPTIIKAEVLLNHAGADVISGNLTVTNGSKYVAAATDATVYAIGDYIRFGTAVTDPCYLITDVDGTNDIITLAIPYQGDSATVTDAAATNVTAANAATADAGVKLSGLPTTGTFVPGMIRYDVTDFKIELKSEFDGTPQSSQSTPSKGSGTYYEVAQNEWFLKGNRGEAFRVADYPVANVLESVEGKTYDQITISYATYGARTIDREVGSFGTIMIATEDASAGAVYANLKTALGI